MTASGKQNLGICLPRHAGHSESYSGEGILTLSLARIWKPPNIFKMQGWPNPLDSLLYLLGVHVYVCISPPKKEL